MLCGKQKISIFFYLDNIWLLTSDLMEQWNSEWYLNIIRYKHSINVKITKKWQLTSETGSFVHYLPLINSLKTYWNWLLICMKDVKATNYDRTVYEMFLVLSRGLDSGYFINAHIDYSLMPVDKTPAQTRIIKYNNFNCTRGILRAAISTSLRLS